MEKFSTFPVVMIARTLAKMSFSSSSWCIMFSLFFFLFSFHFQEHINVDLPMAIMGITGIIGAIALLFIKEKSKTWVEIISHSNLLSSYSTHYLLPIFRRATQTPQINTEDFVVGSEWTLPAKMESSGP